MKRRIPRVRVTLDLTTISARIPARFQRLIDVTTFFQRAIENFEEPLEERIPGSVLPFMPAVAESIEGPDRLREEAKAWLLTWAVTEVLETLGTSVQRAYVACLWMERMGRQTRGYREIENEIRDEGVSFSALTLPAKIRRLGRFGPELIPDEMRYLRSLLEVSECLRHRDGVVAECDRNSDGGLTARWSRMGVWVVDEEGETRVEGFVGVPQVGQVELRPEVGSRTFDVGSRVDLTPLDFIEICWCMTRFAFRLEERVRTFFRQREKRGPSRTPSSKARLIS